MYIHIFTYAYLYIYLSIYLPLSLSIYIYIYIYIYVFMYIHVLVQRHSTTLADEADGRAAGGLPGKRKWPIVLLEISNSMKPYPSVFHAHASKLRPVVGFCCAERSR